MRVTCLIRQQNAKTGEEAWDALDEAFQMLKGDNENDRRARIGFYEHARSHPLVWDDDKFESYKSLEHKLLKEGNMTTAAEANARRGRKEVRSEGEEEAVRLFAATTFGDDTAAILAEHFRDANDPDRLAEVIGWAHGCKTGDDLLTLAWQEW